MLSFLGGSLWTTSSLVGFILFSLIGLLSTGVLIFVVEAGFKGVTLTNVPTFCPFIGITRAIFSSSEDICE